MSYLYISTVFTYDGYSRWDKRKCNDRDGWFYIIPFLKLAVGKILPDRFNFDAM